MLADITAAAADPHLLERATSAAAQLGLPNPAYFVSQYARAIVAEHVPDSDKRLSDVYAYAVATMPPPPGANPAAVTDAHLLHAVGAVAASLSQMAPQPAGVQVVPAQPLPGDGGAFMPPADVAEVTE